MTVRQWPPALVTVVTLTCGVAALEAAHTSHWALAVRLILLAAVADGLDGALARVLDAASAMGAQLDSLADMVAFGVAPAFLFSAYYAGASGWVRHGVALAFVVAGAYRLARFHTLPTGAAFVGLPITAGGTLLAVTVAGPFGTGFREGAAAAMVVAVLMVCRHPFPKPRPSRRSLLAAAAALVGALVVRPRLGTLTDIGAVALGGYVVWGVISHQVTGHHARARPSNDIGIPEGGRPHA